MPQADRNQQTLLRCLAFAVLVLTLAVGAATVTWAAEAKVSKEKLSSGGRDRTYYLFVPESVASATPAPLILLLHGSGRNGYSLVEKWKDIAAREGIIIAGPDAVDSAAWRTPVDGPQFLRELVNTLSAKHPIDARRVYLFGHSAGAEFALRMALLESEYFAAATIHAGALMPDEYSLIEYATRKVPINVCIGTRDPIFPLPLVRATVTALNAKGFTTRLAEVPGHDHNYYIRSPAINRDAWDFLKVQKLDKEPKFTEYR
ncbi:MAG: PHB depolymerase family esterase [Acidobacteriota bacterium]